MTFRTVPLQFPIHADSLFFPHMHQKMWLKLGHCGCNWEFMRQYLFSGTSSFLGKMEIRWVVVKSWLILFCASFPVSFKTSSTANVGINWASHGPCMSFKLKTVTQLIVYWMKLCVCLVKRRSQPSLFALTVLRLLRGCWSCEKPNWTLYWQ